jgi:16S rRNA (uracil1498-N3)-methyltransferase
MSSHPSYPRTRLYVTQPLAEAAEVTLEGNPAHHLLHVLRAGPGDKVALFNGRDGEWQAAISAARKKTATLSVEKRLRPQAPDADLWLLCTPLKGGRSEWVVEKATELGVARISPVLTQFTVADRINEAKLSAISIEAAQQCERLSLPVIDPLAPLERTLSSWPKERKLIFGDESGVAGNARDLLPGLKSGSYGVLIGPEGGFSEGELVLLRSLPYVSGMCMGPGILRADTAAVAALALVQAFGGGWEGKPAFRS